MNEFSSEAVSFYLLNRSYMLFAIVKLFIVLQLSFLPCSLDLAVCGAYPVFFSIAFMLFRQHSTQSTTSTMTSHVNKSIVLIG